MKKTNGRIFRRITNKTMTNQRGGLRNPKGGRPKKEPTDTITVRVPEKHKAKLKELIYEFIHNFLKQQEK